MNDYRFSVSMPDPELGLTLIIRKDQDMEPYKKRLLEKKKNYLEIAELLQDREYGEWIEKAFLQTEKTLRWLFQNNFTQNQISEKFDGALEEFSNRCLEYKSQFISNTLAMEATGEKLSLIDRIITNINTSSPPPLSTNEYLYKLDNNPLYGVLRSQQQEQNAAVGQLGAISVEVTVTAIKTLCNMTPGTKQACQNTLDFGKKTIETISQVGKATLDAVGLKDPLLAISEKIQTTKDRTLKNHNAHLYGISEEVTAKQIENSQFVPLGLAVPGGVMGAMAFWKRVQATKKAETIFSIPTAANSNMYNPSLPNYGHNLYGPIIPRQIEEIALSQSKMNHHPHKTMAIFFDEDLLQKIIPKISSKSTRQETWISTIYPRDATALQEATVNYFGGRGNQLAKVDYKGVSTVIKLQGCAVDISKEVLGLHTFQRLGLKHLETPTPIAVGFDAMRDEFFLAKSYILGTPFDYLLKDIGPVASKSFHLREPKLQDFFTANFYMGKAFGELHTKAFQAVSLYDAKLLLFTESFLERLETTKDAMSKIISLEAWAINSSSPQVKRIISEFKQNPGPLSYGIHDINASQFTWNPHSAGSKVGLVDLEFVPWTQTVDKKPLNPVSLEFHDFRIEIEKEGLAHGLSLKELQSAKNEFATGYFTTYKGMEHSEAASRFFEIDRSLMSIESLIHGIQLGHEVDRVSLIQLILQTKKLFD